MNETNGRVIDPAEGSNGVSQILVPQNEVPEYFDVILTQFSLGQL